MYWKGILNEQLNETFIFLCKVDVIVNTTSKNLDLNQGAVSTSIMKLGGASIQQECHVKYPKGINYGEVAITSGGNLCCKSVYHGALPKWDTDNGMSKQVFLKIFLNAFCIVVKSLLHVKRVLLFLN